LATGTNPNPFYRVYAATAPVISEKAAVREPDLKKTFVYDLATSPGIVYTFVSRE